ncbi:DUF1993 domain-containing protein [Undibacter mobilis]|uniref:DUF1993 domain-containing protein n=1 Tax=Undibacter mobilis TaxID=2292256 RepID=A0A371BBX7_9BRAD|nr:DUF1993 domain-containing protein [Undibacter mobilis]RDV05072.1 DUF1993 domain-containing protein [Undibacter mobilis]
MSYSMSQNLIPICVTGLNALSGVLDKAVAQAAAKKVDPSVLLGWRLAPDMFALTRQVQAVCDQAKNGASRLASIDPPKFEDTETTVEQLKERIARTVAHIKSLDAAAIDASSAREIMFPLGPKKGKMKGVDYLNHFVLPNFFFHLTACYAIARNFGTDLAKRDFLGAIPLTMVE